MKNIILFLISIFIFSQAVFAEDVWINDARDLFLKNSMHIYEINIRTFNATDSNNNGIIDFDDGEESGNFLNAISRLDEIAENGSNTIQLMPIMELGKTKALGTAGSLYAPLSFNKLNPQLESRRTALSVESQAIKFINEAHKRKIRVIVEVPAFASYELYLKNPSLFVSGKDLIPGENTDIRVLNGGNETSVNREVLKLYRDYVDYVISLGVDGIVANEASTKPAKFWEELISYSRRKDPHFLWVAQISERNKQILPDLPLTSCDKLLNAGFDGYYGNFGNIHSAKELMAYVKNILGLKNKYASPKAVVGAFLTHDSMSPVADNNISYLDNVFWMNAILPVNSFITDGLTTGDSFIYLYGNKKAFKSFTDSNIYYVNRGKVDIFNFSRKPGGKYLPLRQEFIEANRLKYNVSEIYNAVDFKFIELKTSSPDILGFALSGGKYTLISYANMTKSMQQDVKIYIPFLKGEDLPIPIKLGSIPKIESGKLSTQLMPYEVNILLMENVSKLKK